MTDFYHDLYEETLDEKMKYKHKAEELEDKLNDCGLRHLQESARIKELELAMQEFIDRTNKATWPDQVPVYVESFYDKFKKLLK